MVLGALILVVDADPRILTMLTDGLLFRGFRVRTAGSAAEAVRAIASERPSLVLMDLDILADNRAALSDGLVSAADRVPLIVLSTTSDGAARARELGAIACVTKPVDVDRLFASIRSTLDGFS